MGFQYFISVVLFSFSNSHLCIYSWLINGTDVDVEVDSHYHLIDGNLIIKNASMASDFGKYQCRAENSIGAVLSREASLHFACE